MMKNSLIIFSFFVAGLLLGISRKLPAFLTAIDLSTPVLYVLLFLIGISLGADKNMKQFFRQINFKIALIPLGVCIGTLAGACIVSFLLPLTVRETMAVGAGFGWYSLSSVFIGKLHSQSLGVIALLSNVTREILTLLLTPLLVRHVGKLSGIASGGATAMDTTLPIIIRASGKEYAFVSIFSGLALSVLVPLLVTFILK
ncbi:MAG: lysine exporter LysO family protein [Prolixibacteraceae bacterium]|nr:lysine exporter LysO family protein [Prolixibacteraceae bacterium]